MDTVAAAVVVVVAVVAATVRIGVDMSRVVCQRRMKVSCVWLDCRLDNAARFAIAVDRQ